jgi:hypothetical protein
MLTNILKIFLLKMIVQAGKKLFKTSTKMQAGTSFCDSFEDDCASK